MKVKKFRIKPRLGIVGRTLKSKMSVKKLPVEIEESLPEESEALLADISPSAFYQTWHGEAIPPQFREALEEAGFNKSIAISALAATVGPSPEDKLSELLMEGETARTQVLTVLSDEMADQAFNFIFKLLADDAKSDDCEISTPVFLDQNQDLLPETLILLEAENEDIEIDSASHLSPRFTRVALVGWLPTRRKKRLTSSSKKKLN